MFILFIIMEKIIKYSNITVIGGGITGCSIAYHLAKLGQDVLLLEKSGLTHGSTWHAAGLVGQLRNSSNLTKMLQYSTQLYNELEDKTGQATEWKQVDSLRLASTIDRWTEIRRSVSIGKGFDFDVELLDPNQVKDLCPIIDTNRIIGAAYVPTDGHVEPTSLTNALAKGAKMHGAEFMIGTEGNMEIDVMGKRIKLVELNMRNI
jgi:sarcosine dehydrogenase